MNEGPVSTLLGLRGAPGAGEAIMVERDVLLAELTGGSVHIAHAQHGRLRGRGAARQGARRARHRRGHAAPPAPHRRARAATADYDTAHQDEPAAARGGGPPGAASRACATATIDCIATDHAPHTVRRQEGRVRPGRLRHRRAWRRRCALCLDRLVGAGVCSTCAQLVALLSTRPGARPRPARRHARPGRARGRDASSTSQAPRRSTPRASRARAATRRSAGWTLQGLAGPDDRGRARRLAGREARLIARVWAR